jgi:hypothetical protein
MSNSFTKRINKEIQLYQKDNFTFSNLILQPSSDLSIWYFVIYNLKDTEYDNGIYLGKVMLPPKYPFKAPDFMFLSESGRFKTSMCSGLVSFMTDDSTKSESQGIGHLNESSDIRKKIANDSIKNIKQNKIAFSILNEYFKDYFNELKLT